MSGGGGLSIWVGDLDAYINVDFSADYQREAEQYELDRELDNIGEIPLLAGKATSAWQLNDIGIKPSEWRHAVHQAEMAMGPGPTPNGDLKISGRHDAEECFIRAMLNLGRSYAVARYTRREGLDYPSGITATLPLGIRALVNQFLAAEGIPRSISSDELVRTALSNDNAAGMTAYRRTGNFQASLHFLADQEAGHAGGRALDRDRTRSILALVRLYFSVLELRITSLNEIRGLFDIYSADREALGNTQDRLTSNGQVIRGWRQRHIKPLLALYPYSIRKGVMRALKSSNVSREAMVNELAFAHCGVLQMRRAGRDRARSR